MTTTQAKSRNRKPAQDQPKPAEPYALADTEGYPQTFYRPVVKICVPNLDGGETVETITTCPHDPSLGGNHWGHKDQDAALRCARHLAAQRGLPIGPPK